MQGNEAGPVVLRILNLGTRWSWMAKFLFRPPYLRERTDLDAVVAKSKILSSKKN
jgi:hypothetical protein